MSNSDWGYIASRIDYARKVLWQMPQVSMLKKILAIIWAVNGIFPTIFTEVTLLVA